jgi:hypothetical protein
VSYVKNKVPFKRPGVGLLSITGGAAVDGYPAMYPATPEEEGSAGGYPAAVYPLNPDPYGLMTQKSPSASSLIPGVSNAILYGALGVLGILVVVGMNKR